MSGALPFARLAVHIVAGLGVSKIVKDVVVNNTNVASPLDLVRVWTGSVVIGSMITEMTSKYVNTQMDEIIAWHKSRQTNLTAVK